MSSLPPVRGVVEPLFFFDHEYPESGEEEVAHAVGSSKKNAGEAALVVSLARYRACCFMPACRKHTRVLTQPRRAVLQQGYEPSQLAVLTPYVGQAREAGPS